MMKNHRMVGAALLLWEVSLEPMTKTLRLWDLDLNFGHWHNVCNHLHRVIACFVVHAKKGHWELRTVDHCYFCFLNPSPKLGNEPTVATHNKPILILTVFIWWCACWTINLRNVAEGSTPREGPGERRPGTFDWPLKYCDKRGLIDLKGKLGDVEYPDWKWMRMAGMIWINYIIFVDSAVSEPNQTI